MLGFNSIHISKRGPYSVRWHYINQCQLIRHWSIHLKVCRFFNETVISSFTKMYLKASSVISSLFSHQCVQSALVLTASYTRIFRMTTIMTAPATVWVVAISKLVFRARALQIIQPNASWPLPKLSTLKCGATGVSQHTTYDLSIQVIPSVITDRTPFVIVQDFHASFVVHAATDKSNFTKIPWCHSSFRHITGPFVRRIHRSQVDSPTKRASHTLLWCLLCC